MKNISLLHWFHTFSKELQSYPSFSLGTCNLHIWHPTNVVYYVNLLSAKGFLVNSTLFNYYLRYSRPIKYRYDHHVQLKLLGVNTSQPAYFWTDKQIFSNFDVKQNTRGHCTINVFKLMFANSFNAKFKRFRTKVCRFELGFINIPPNHKTVSEYLPQILMGASSSKSIGWDMNMAVAFKHSAFMTLSSNFTGFAFLFPRTEN